MITEVTLRLKTRFEDEEQLDYFLEEMMETLNQASDERIVGYEVDNYKEEEEESGANHDPFRPGEGELSF